MSDNYVAFSEIRVGKKDGSVRVIAENDDVSDLSESDVEILLASGSIGKAVDVPKAVTDQIDTLQSEVESKDAEIAALKAELAKSKAPIVPATPATPAK